MEIFNYLLKVSACSALFFAFYLLVLRKLTFFRFNRFYLLGSLLLSFIIPAMQFTVEREVVQSTVAAPPINMPVPAIDDHLLTSVSLDRLEVEGTGNFNWLDVLPLVYVAIVLGLLLIAAWRLFQLFKHTKVPVKEINGLKLVAKETGFTNCSFFNYVFIDEKSLTHAELSVLLAHEEVHARQYHSVDKLLLMIAKAFLWFNPIIYLYDKELEQAHEYEADELTSRSIGTETYATLLLNLAVSKSQNPLLHNFVKSPIKQRIKMLFNSKSKNMKKLAYLLALPIGLGLIWGFTVKITHRVKPLVQQETAPLQDTLSGKFVTGKIIGFDKSKMGEFLNLKVGEKILAISSYNFKDKVKIGDEISVDLGGKSSLPPPPKITSTTTDAKGNKTVYTGIAPYMALKVVGANGKMIYEQPKYAFLYEANRARYAWSTIKSIQKNASGVIEKIVLHDKNGFTINLNLTAQRLKTDDFKKGDDIVVKFIGEKLTGDKTYTTDKMIALYSWPKKHELINKALYSKFYHENGRQKVYISSAKVKTTQDLVSFNSNKTMITDIDDAATYPSGKVKPKSEAYNLLSKLSYANADSIKTFKVMDDAFILRKNVKMNIDNYAINGKIVAAKTNSNVLTVHNGSVKKGTEPSVEAKIIEFNITTKEVKIIES